MSDEKNDTRSLGNEDQDKPVNILDLNGFIGRISFTIANLSKISNLFHPVVISVL
jgi:hypothetical protein